MRGLGLLVVCALGCRPTGASDPPATRPPEPTEAPPEDSNTYISGKAGDDAAGGDEPPAAAEDPAVVPGLAAKIDTIAAARELVVDTTDKKLVPGSERMISPAMVAKWPTDVPALVFIVYPLEPSKAGINTFKVGAPLEVTIDLIEGAAKQRALKRGELMREVKFDRDGATVRQNLETAEQTLIDVLLQRRPVERSLVLLDGYREWFNHHLEMMTDLDKRMPTALRWLRKPSVDAKP